MEGDGGYRAVLRIHRENYHSRNAIASELAWATALQEESGIETPVCIRGRDGDPIQTASIAGLAAPRHMVMFAFVEGCEPEPDQDLTALFRHLGQIAARAHDHAMRWQRPTAFERLTWDEQAVFGATPTWGNWRHGPGVTGAIRSVLERLEQALVERLVTFGKQPHRYGLIHADMRLSNLLIDRGTVRLIDFDDCGLGWYLYDFAAAISFMEDHPQVPALKQSWIDGYRQLRSLPEAEEREIDTFIMLRRMALLAWMGTHPEVDIARDLAPTYAAGTAILGQAYLSRSS